MRTDRTSIATALAVIALTWGAVAACSCRRAHDAAGDQGGDSPFDPPAPEAELAPLPRRPAPPPPADLADPEAMELFRWLDAFGFEDTGRMEPVRVSYSPRAAGASAWDPSVRIGFVHARGPSGSLVVHLLEPTRHDASASVEPVDLAAAFREQIAWLRAHGPVGDSAARDGFDRARETHASVLAQLVALARAAHRRSMNEEAMALMTLARAEATRDAANEQRFAERAKRELLEHLLWDAVVACGDRGWSRDALRARFARIGEHGGADAHAARARSYQAVLVQMLAEDRAHDAGAASGAERTGIHEAIYWLREQRGWQRGQPGFANVLDARPGSSRSAAYLSARGLDAAPALVALLDDRRLTRTVGFHRDFHFSHRVLTYGDAAEQVLRRTTGRAFANRAEGEAWLASRQSSGGFERQLAELRTEQTDLAGRARGLFELDGARAAREITAMVRAETDPARRRLLIDAIAERREPEVTELLREVLGGDGSLELHLAAARALASRRDPVWVELFSGALLRSNRTRTGAFEVTRAAELLLEQGDARARDALERAYAGMPPAARLEVLDVLAARSTSADTRAALEPLLRASLEDGSVLYGVHEGANLGSEHERCLDPTVAELAAVQLSAPYGVPYRCTWPPYRRARALVELRNHARAAHNESRLPLPAEPPALPASRGASVVREVRFVGAAASLSFAARARASAGRALTDAQVLSWVRGVLAEAPRGVFVLSVHRDGFSRGVSVELRFARESAREAGLMDYDVMQRVGSTASNVDSLTGGFTPSQSLGARESAVLTAAVRAMLEADASEDRELRVRIEWHNR